MHQIKQNLSFIIIIFSKVLNSFGKNIIVEKIRLKDGTQNTRLPSDTIS